ncbi:ABC transporter permease [Halorubrum sp. RMP-47]|uniref:ABC transporter permease n=1 Tax=Halorubrum miltondacostae TaxID=3076378 RepID=A0ABD5M660_9EURY
MGRWEYFLKRVLLMVPIVFLGTTVTFLILRVGPIDPAAAIIGPSGDTEAYAAVRDSLGLDQPLWIQYAEFMRDLLTLQLGESWVVVRGQSVWDLVGIYGPRTIWLGFWSILIPIFIGLPLGFYAGLNPNTLADYIASFGGIVWRAMPNFWLAVIFVSVLTQSEALFGFSWGDWLVETQIVTPPDLSRLWEPTQFLGALKAILPAALVLGSASMGNEMRIGRTAVLETKNANYVETAKAKGVPGRLVVWKHMFRNALIPLVPVITGEAFLLLGGSVLVETVFAINGLGYLFFQATINGDVPLVGSLMFLFILLSVGINILQDFLYTVIDPRVGYDGGA